jgi:hypothetical protein
MRPISPSARVGWPLPESLQCGPARGGRALGRGSSPLTVNRFNFAARPWKTHHRAGLVGCPYTATTTLRSKLFSDHTPSTVLAQSDMIAL